MTIILDLCGGTGAWSKPWVENGYKVINVTFPDYDVRDFKPPKKVYGILAAPPCPMFSFVRTNAKAKRDLAGALEIVEACLKIIRGCQLRIEKDTQKKPPIAFWALENPSRGMLKWFLGKPAFVFQPYEFGDNYKKETALWGYFKEPEKRPVSCDKPKFDRLLSSEIHGEFYGKLTRTERRSITPQGFAQAFYEANKEGA